MTLRWPDTLPGASMPGFGLSPLDPNIRTDMEVGQQKVRRRTFYRIDRVSALWIFKDAEMKAFRSFMEGLPVSLAGASDSLAAWTLLSTTLSAGVTMGPDGVTTADRIMETVTLGVHRASVNLPGANVDNISILARATLRAAGRTKARLAIVDRAGLAGTVDIDLTTGILSGANGLLSYSVLDRGNGWWRVTITDNSGVGAAVPIFRILALDATGAFSYTGDITKGLDICEMQARLPTGFDLFVPSDALGNAMGANGGAAWFWMLVPAGGGLTLAETRFTGPYKAVAMSGLRWSVTAEVEVRNA